MKTEANQPVNACNETVYYGSEDEFTKSVFHAGLTKLEYFAAMAMQGILANPDFSKNQKDVDIHLLAVVNADELIKALNKIQ